MVHEAFIGRERELALLRQAAAQRGGALIPIYGRRRVGKSELILHLLKGRSGIYFLGKQAPAAQQRREFLRTAAKGLDAPHLASLDAGDWRAAFEAVLASARPDQRLLIALDEFQWMVEASPELPSLLQELWDLRLRKEPVLLILCGSYIGFMEREVLGRKSPLFGRRTAQIHLQPFGFREARAFHPRYSLLDCARSYFICGGVPLYLRAFRDDQSVEQNIRDSLLSEFAPLYREPDFLLREELREVHNYYAILMALATGSAPAKDVAARAGIPERSLPFYLRQLLDLRYLHRRHPLTGSRQVSRQVRYGLEDPLLRFWFRFVYPNNSFLASMGATRAFNDLIKPELDSYFGACFERLCREALPRLYQQEGVSAAFEVGEYWDKDLQIDVVGLRQDGVTDLGECKWGAPRSLPTLRTDLLDRAARYPNRRGATLLPRLFLRQRPKASAPDLRVHDLAALYEEEP